MSPKYIIKLLFFLSALAWMAVNVVGGIMALATGGTTPHIVTHAAVALGCGVAAWFLRPRRRQQAALTEPDPRLEVLEAELSELQQKLHEQQRSLEFTEQLLAKKPESRNDQP